MFNALLNYVREIRQRRADLKTTSIGRVGLDFRKLLEDAQQERDRLWNNPPPCGLVIRYTQKYGYEKCHGEFLFRTEDIEQALKAILHENPHLANDDEGAILNWVQGCDGSLTQPTEVPTLWSRFRFVADDLIRAGKVEICCRACGATIAPDQITTQDDRNQPGWNFDRIICPQGHKLLVAESIHLVTR